MKTFLLFIVILITQNNCHADICTFDQANQIERLKSIVKTHPGGVLNKKTHTIIWKSPLANATSIQYEGCELLSFTINKKLAPSKILSEAEVLSLAAALASEYWDDIRSEPFISGIAERKFSISTIDDSTFYNIPREYYDSFFIEKNLSKGYITIKWATYY